MTTQGVLVESVFSGLTGEVGNFVNKRLSAGRVAFHPSGGGNTYKNVYASATVGGSTLFDQSVNQGILLDGSGSAEVYAVGHYSCKAYDSEGVLQRTFDLRIGDVTSDSSGGSAVSTNTLNIKTSYGITASDVNNAIAYANTNSSTDFVFLFKDANFTLENNMIFPSNATIQVDPTAKLMIYAGVNAITINGEIRHDFNQIFKYENNTTCTVTIIPKAAEQGYPQWFGAVPDGTSDSRFAIDRLLQTGIKRVVLSGGNFKLNSNLTIPSTVEIIRKGGSDFTLASGVTVSGLGTKATVFDKISATSILGPVIGNVTGNVTGDVTGNLTGSVTGNTTGNHTGNVTGAVTGNGSAITNLAANNISSGTLADARLSSNVTKKGNSFNGASQLVQLDSSQRFPAKSGTLITNLNGSNISSGTVADARLSANVTKQGNSFNGANQLVKLDANQNLNVKGAVLQVVSTTKTDTFSYTGNTFTNVTGLSASITPKSASSKILILFNISSGTRDSYTAVRLAKNSTLIATGTTSGGRTGVATKLFGAVSFSGEYNVLENSGMSYQDSPNTTSEVTYSIQIANTYSGHSDRAIYINRTFNDSDGDHSQRGISTITVMEIGG